MPTTIRLSTTPGVIRNASGYAMLVLDLFGPSMAHRDVTVRRTDEIAPVVQAFGEYVRAAHPEASFKIDVLVAKGQRKPPGFDAARKSGAFGDVAFLRTETRDGGGLQPGSEAKTRAAA